MTHHPGAGDTVGRYELVGELGRGGMGMVFAATDTRLNRPAAVKLILGAMATDEDFLTRFQREADALARIESAHVIDIYDYGRLDGVAYLATQYVAGGDLGAALRARGSLPVDRALDVCAQVAEALAAAHRVGVVHRDVKPANVLLRDPDAAQLHAYLCDFGIAQTAEARLTATGVVAGTWAYLAPERVHGADGTPASDIYALGCVLWECLTGSQPFAGTDMQMAFAHVSSPIPRFVETTSTARALNHVIGRAMAKDPGARHPDAQALADELQSLAAGPVEPRFDARAVVAPTQATLPDVPRTRRRGLVIGAVASVLALVAVLGGLALWLAGGDDGPADERSAPGRVEDGVTGDIDGDGLGDLLVQTIIEDESTGQRVQWLSDGSMVGDEERTGNKGYEDYLSGDFDADGLLDTAEVSSFVEYEPASAEITYGDGDEEKVEMDLPPAPRDGGAESTLVGDFDGDGHDDLAFAIQPADAPQDPPLDLETGRAAVRSCTLWVVRQVDTKPTDPESWLEDVPCFVPDLAVGDLQGDGRDDLVLLVDSDTPWAGSVSEDERLLPILSTGEAFAPGRLATVEGTNVGRIRITAGDVDADGDDDLVAAVEVTKQHDAKVPLEMRVYSADADGAFAEARTWLETGRYEWGVDNALLAVSDVDGDGRDDVLVGLVIDEALSLPEQGPEPGTDVPIDVLRSADGSFAEPEQWAVCEECAAYFAFYGPVSDFDSAG